MGAARAAAKPAAAFGREKSRELDVLIVGRVGAIVVVVVVKVKVRVAVIALVFAVVVFATLGPKRVVGRLQRLFRRATRSSTSGSALAAIVARVSFFERKQAHALSFERVDDDSFRGENLLPAKGAECLSGCG